MRLTPFLVAVFSLLVTRTSFGQDTDNDNPPAQKASSPMLKLKAVVSFSPMQFSENGVGIAFSFETVFDKDKDGIVAIYIPVITTVNVSGNFENGSPHQRDGMVYYGLGLKFYPTGCYGRVKYALGPTLVQGMGTQTDYPAYSYYHTYSKFIFGILVSNSLNINATDHVYLGLDLGLGYTFINAWDQKLRGMAAITQGGFKIGYRF